MRGFDKFFAGTTHIFAILKSSAETAFATFTMSLELTDVKRLANLARLELTDAQASATLDKLNGIFSLVEQMKAVDTTGVEPLNHPIAAFETDLSLRLREDAVTEPDRRADYQEVAPATQDGLYLVPKVIE
jgi:aspartyl-tRNA(Asn)/glutamyl-tRNA(Gln) amidotransferase subunit C